MSSERARWRRYLRFWGPDVAADVDDELQYHLDMRTQNFIKRGLSPDDAREAARRLFGDARGVNRALRAHDAKKLRRARRTDMVQDLMYDIRHGLRQFRTAPRFTASVVAVLALGIGANSAIYSAVDAAFFRPLPFANPDRLVVLQGATIPSEPQPGLRQHAKATPYLSDFQADRTLFSGVAAYATGGLNLVGDAEPMRTTVTFVTTDFFGVLGRMPVIGRPLSLGETSPGGGRGAVLSYALWQGEFGGDRSVLGRRVTLNDTEYEIVGVMPDDFTFPAKTDLWVGLAVPFSRSLFEAFHNYLPSRFIARLAPGATPELAAHHVEALSRQFRPERRRDPSTVATLAQPLQQTLIGSRGTALVVLMASAMLLLLIACANVTNLLLLRAASRQREIGVRVAIGATRFRVVRQLLVESMLLAAAGAVLALGVARLGLAALASTLPASLADVAPPSVDVRVLGFTMLVAIATSVLFGLWPAIGISGVNLQDALKLGGGATRRRGTALRGALVVAEISLALMLVIGAGLLLESLRSLLRVNTGMRTEHVVTARMTLPTARYKSSAAATAFVDEVRRSISSVAGVEAVGVINTLPMAGEGGIALRNTAENVPDDSPRSAIAELLAVSPGYFEAIGAPLRGDDLPASYDSTRKVAIVNEAMANILWPGENAIGKRIVGAIGGALGLAGIGVYAVLAYGVAQRTRELGVRIALGASSRDVLRLVIGRGAWFAAAGVAVGIAGSLAMSRYLGSILYETSPHDPRVFVAAPLILSGDRNSRDLVPGASRDARQPDGGPSGKLIARVILRS